MKQMGMNTAINTSDDVIIANATSFVPYTAAWNGLL